MLSGGKNKREFPRVSLNSPVNFQVRGDPIVSAAVSCDISAGGCSFVTDHYIPPATPLMLEIPVLSRFLRPVGEVVWSQPLQHSYRNRLGVKFIEFNALEKNYLKDFVQMHQQL